MMSTQISSPVRGSQTGPSPRSARASCTSSTSTCRGSYVYDRHVPRLANEDLVTSPRRAGARAHLRAMGLDERDWGKPLVGIATTWTGTMPCNLNHRALAARVADGIRAAGGTPLEFNTIAISDNLTQGTPGMRASLVSRELIADSVELVGLSQPFDGIVCIGGCDKTVPGLAMGLLRLDVPGADPLLRGDGGRLAQRSARDHSGRVGGRSAPTRAAGSTTGSSSSSNATPVPVSAPAPGTSRRTRWPSRSTSSGSGRSASGASRPRTPPRATRPRRPVPSSSI